MVTYLDHILAEDIAEDLLYRTGRALLDDQIQGIADCFALPQSIETTEGARIMRTPEDVDSAFAQVRLHLKSSDVIDVIRTVVEAKFATDDEIHSFHVSQLQKSDGSSEPSGVAAYSKIKRCADGVWRIAHSSYVTPKSRELGCALVSWKPGTSD